jgi:predicted adenylyl cyclase CyaB
MPTNLEIKARAASLHAADEVARRIGARYEYEMEQVDTYFDARSGRLKLREVDGTRFELIGYMRGEETERRVSDFDVHPLSAADPLKSILSEVLGVRGVIKKRRKLYLYRATRIHMDDVAGLGAFIEFETEVRGSREDAREELDSLIRIFGIQEGDFLKVSYIDLHLAKQEAGQQRR